MTEPVICRRRARYCRACRRMTRSVEYYDGPLYGFRHGCTMCGFHRSVNGACGWAPIAEGEDVSVRRDAQQARTMAQWRNAMPRALYEQFVQAEEAAFTAVTEAEQASATARLDALHANIREERKAA